ncbi:TPD1 protein homolog 1-like [Salvia hispanica]|uniref:TPD1 protein homolog 1-like n=1 Tax=Salvia hispanica TaxID=49212 RepID=UPI0020095F27|nr:TPD1 protein homolog 1-like [Salvia hispanica]
MRLAIAVLSILCFISTAFGKCGVNELVIGTVRSGRQIGGKPEWNVQVVNNCNCSQSNIVLTCSGFQTVKPVDPSIFQRNGDHCSVNGGRPLLPRADVKFSYAWDPPFFLFPFSTKPLC